MVAVPEITSKDDAGLSWRDELPSLAGERVLLRELRAEDARPLFRIVRAPEVSRYIWPPPATIEQFEHFIDWTHSERACGKYIGFGIFPGGGCEAVGLFELRQMQPGFLRAELGFFIDPALFGRGLFSDAARLVLNFAFHVVGIHRIEARVAVENDRSNNALSKIGARQEGVLRAAFVRGGRYVDQYLWAIVSTSYQQHDDRPPHGCRAPHRRLRS